MAGAAFADILDEKVSGSGRSGGVAAPPPRPRLTPPHPLLFAKPFRPSSYRMVTSDAGSAYAQPQSRPPAPPSLRPSRTLTRRQRQALDAFIELGARLTPDFGAGELRSAFRMLALTYHPDRHPGSTEAEQVRLTRVLADLNEHHRCLMAALRPAA